MGKFLFVTVILAAFVSVAFASAPIAGHVVLIGLDGWGAYSVPKADMPVVKSMMEHGCYTLQKRTVLPSSSAPNWASMFMGVPTELHGYTQWGSKTPELPAIEGYGRARHSAYGFHGVPRRVARCSACLSKRMAETFL